jgi:hypothetical protein
MAKVIKPINQIVAPQAPQPQQDPDSAIKQAYMRSMTDQIAQPKSMLDESESGLKSAVSNFGKGNIGEGLEGLTSGIGSLLSSSAGKNILGALDPTMEGKLVYGESAQNAQGQDSARAQAYAQARAKQQELQKEYAQTKDKEAYDSGQKELERKFNEQENARNRSLTEREGVQNRGVQYSAQNLQDKMAMQDKLKDMLAKSNMSSEDYIAAVTNPGSLANLKTTRQATLNPLSWVSDIGRVNKTRLVRPS